MIWNKSHLNKDRIDQLRHEYRQTCKAAKDDPALFEYHYKEATRIKQLILQLQD